MGKESRKKLGKGSSSQLTHTEEIKHYIGVVSEEFQGRVSAIAEQFGGLHEKLDTHDRQFSSIHQKLDSHDRQFTSIHQKLDTHDRHFSSINEKLDSHTEMIGKLMEDMTIVKSDVEIIKSDLKKKVDYDEFHSLVKRVEKLESR